MSSLVSRGLLAALVAGGATLFGATAAHATELPEHRGGQHGPLVTVSAPITVDRNAVALLGHSRATGTSAVSSSSSSARSTDRGPFSGATAGRTGSGWPVAGHVPVSVDRDAVAVLGTAGTDEGASTASRPASRQRGFLLGISAPVAAEGNAVTVLGSARTRTSRGSEAASGRTCRPGSTGPSEDWFGTTSNGTASGHGEAAGMPAMPGTSGESGWAGMTAPSTGTPAVMLTGSGGSRRFGSLAALGADSGAAPAGWASAGLGPRSSSVGRSGRGGGAGGATSRSGPASDDLCLASSTVSSSPDVLESLLWGFALGLLVLGAVWLVEALSRIRETGRYRAGGLRHRPHP